jgi:hypothetical protein
VPGVINPVCSWINFHFGSKQTSKISLSFGFHSNVMSHLIIDSCIVLARLSDTFRPLYRIAAETFYRILFNARPQRANLAARLLSITRKHHRYDGCAMN